MPGRGEVAGRLLALPSASGRAKVNPQGRTIQEIRDAAERVPGGTERLVLVPGTDQVETQGLPTAVLGKV